jgi:hypothetical protein
VEQCGRAVAALLSPPELPIDENDKRATVSQFGNGTVYISSFLISQKDMFERVQRVTGTTGADWKISYKPSAQRYEDGIEAIKKGDMRGFGKQLHTRVMFPEGGGNFSSKLNNKALGLPQEDLYERTKITVGIAENNELS